MFKQVTYLLTALLLITLFSCSDDVVTPPVEPPPPPPIPNTADYFNWRAIQIGGIPYTMYAIDTGDIYLDVSDRLMWYNKGRIKEVKVNLPYFSISRVHGYENTVLVAGEYNRNPFNPALFIIKDGAHVNTYSIPDLHSVICWVYPEGENRAWIGVSDYPIIYHFENGSFKKYLLADSLQRTRIYSSKGEIYAFARSNFFLHSFKLVNDTFQLIAIDRLGGNSGITEAILSCGDDIMMMSLLNIYYFNGSQWIWHSQVPQPPMLRLGGVSKDSLVNFGLTPHWFRPQVLIKGVWKPEENRFPDIYYDPMQFLEIIQYKAGFVIFSISGESGGSYIIIGEPVKKGGQWK